MHGEENTVLMTTEQYAPKDEPMLNDCWYDDNVDVTEKSYGIQKTVVSD